MNVQHTEYAGPITGFADGAGIYDSYISVGAYDNSINDTNNPIYSPINNFLDTVDIDNFFTGRLVNGTYTTTADWTDITQLSPAQGQNIGITVFTGYTTISDMTAF